MNEHHLKVTRTARYYTLGTKNSSLKEVWLVLHGYGQLAGFFIRHFSEIDDGTRLIAAPEGLSRFYIDGTGGRVGATWMTREERLNEIADYRAYLHSLCGELFAGIDRQSVEFIALGFSQGTATLCRWLQETALRPDRVVLWAGMVPPEFSAEELRGLFAGIRLQFVLGDKDEYAVEEQVAGQIRRLTEAGAAPEQFRFAGRHQMHRPTLRRLAQLQEPASRRRRASSSK